MVSLYTPSPGWLLLANHWARPRLSRADSHPHPASLSKTFRTLPPTGAPPSLCNELCFLTSELGPSGTEGVDTVCILPRFFHRVLWEPSHPLTEQPDRPHWVREGPKWARAEHSSFIGSVPGGRAGSGLPRGCRPCSRPIFRSDPGAPWDTASGGPSSMTPPLCAPHCCRGGALLAWTVLLGRLGYTSHVLRDR